MKRLICVLLCLIMLVVGMVSCTGGEGKKPLTQTTGTETTEQPTVEEDDKTTPPEIVDYVDFAFIYEFGGLLSAFYTAVKENRDSATELASVLESAQPALDELIAGFHQ